LPVQVNLRLWRETVRRYSGFTRIISASPTSGTEARDDLLIARRKSTGSGMAKSAMTSSEMELRLLGA